MLSYIKQQTLSMCKTVTPETKEVGTASNGDRIFFEETEGSLKNRYYGYNGQTEPSSWNLLYQHNNELNKVTKDYLENINIEFNEGYDMDLINYALSQKRNNFNPFKKPSDRKKVTIWVNDKEFEMVKEFIRRVRRAKI